MIILWLSCLAWLLKVEALIKREAQLQQENVRGSDAKQAELRRVKAELEQKVCFYSGLFGNSGLFMSLSVKFFLYFSTLPLFIVPWSLTVPEPYPNEP